MSTMHTPDHGVSPSLSLFPEESSVTVEGELVIGGCRTTEIAEQYGTPAYVVDERGLRRQIRRFIDGMAARWPNSEVLFASKSLPCVAMYAIAQSEGLSVDVAGGGELMMALAAGVDPQRIYLHGNAKSDAEIAMAVQSGVKAIIIDNLDDLERLGRLVTTSQGVLVRIIPSISADTHASQATGGSDSKFGLTPDQSRLAIERIASSPMLRLEGIHVHVGSQLLEPKPFVEAVKFVGEFGEFATYDIGGGLGVRYVLEETPPSVEEYLDAITEAAHRFLPANAKLLIEPGRSLVARAGMTLYTVNSVKDTGKTFVAVDGGMADNLNVALTGQPYTAVVANKMNFPREVECDVVGRQCESGDFLVNKVMLADPVVGDLIAMPVTGAYAYTTANNYNGARIPPIIFCADGTSNLAVERQSYEDILRPHLPALQRKW